MRELADAVTLPPAALGAEASEVVAGNPAAGMLRVSVAM